MATDETVVYVSRPPLPRVGPYLRALFDLGMKSIPAAIPALLFLWFYHFGTALYLELASGGTSKLGYRDGHAVLIQIFMTVSAYLPLLVLVYTPFLPFQDAMLRGQPITFLAAIRHVLERLVPFVLSVILQMAIVFAPVLLVCGALIAVVAPFSEALPREAAVMMVLVTIGPVVVWLFSSGIFLSFAVPAVVLDDYGAARSISVSVRLVAGNFWGVLWRLFVFFLAVFAVLMIVMLPPLVLGAIAAAATRADLLFRIMTILWTSLANALTFPFWVGALVVLYRSLAPAGSAAVGEAAAGTAPIAAGEHPTPFIFE